MITVRCLTTFAYLCFKTSVNVHVKGKRMNSGEGGGGGGVLVLINEGRIQLVKR